MNWPNWYVQLCCTCVLVIAFATLVFITLWLGGLALYELWRFLKIEYVVIRAIGDHVKQEAREREAKESENASAETGRP